jgi:hypothetical protein
MIHYFIIAVSKMEILRIGSLGISCGKERSDQTNNAPYFAGSVVGFVWVLS